MCEILWVSVKSDLDNNVYPRKEVIQPQVPLRLPCYDLTPITAYTLANYLPCGLAHLLLIYTTFVV
jgi:hypothetical protein